jgi:hypothetical protein
MSTYLHKITSLPELIAEWAVLDKNGTDIAGIRALCLTDLYYLLVKVCRRVDLLHPWIYARCREFEAAPNNHIDIWFREAGKSSIITFGKTIQDILNDPEITVGIFSQSGGIASKFLIQIKQELESNEILKSVFPDILYDNPSKDSPSWNQGSITVRRLGNPKESTVECSGLVDSMPIGRHYKLLIYDDTVTPSSVNTPEQIHKTTEAYELSLSLGSEGCIKRIIGTRYNFADTYDSIIQKGVVKLRLYAATDDGTPNGKPVLFSEDYWNQKKIELSASILACQYLGDPLSGTEKMFDTNDLEFYEIRPSSLNVYIVVDPAKSKNKGSDATAVAVIGVDAALNKYLLDGFNDKLDLSERWTVLDNMWKKWTRMPGVAMVKVGYEKFSANADLDYFKEQMQLSTSKFPIVELGWTSGGMGESSKTDRVQRLGPDLKRHKILLPYPTRADKLTKAQKSMMDQGFDYRVSKSIKRKDMDGRIYDLSEIFKQQLGYFPVGKKDLVDAVSRIYDMEIKAPYISHESDTMLLEPMYP